MTRPWKVVEIDTCLMCPYGTIYTEHLGSPKIYLCMYVDPKGREIPEPISEIPTWCPLEDAK